jgi:hypothetical protein
LYSLSLSLTHTLSPTPSHTFSPPLSLTHTHILSHILVMPHALTLHTAPALARSLARSLAHSNRSPSVRTGWRTTCAWPVRYSSVQKCTAHPQAHTQAVPHPTLRHAVRTTHYARAHPTPDAHLQVHVHTHSAASFTHCHPPTHPPIHPLTHCRLPTAAHPPAHPPTRHTHSVRGGERDDRKRRGGRQARHPAGRQAGCA